jgi:hypothetical protein
MNIQHASNFDQTVIGFFAADSGLRLLLSLALKLLP